MACGRYFLVGILAFLISPFCLGRGKQAPPLTSIGMQKLPKTTMEIEKYFKDVNIYA